MLTNDHFALGQVLIESVANGDHDLAHHDIFMEEDGVQQQKFAREIIVTSSAPIELTRLLRALWMVEISEVRAW